MSVWLESARQSPTAHRPRPRGVRVDSPSGPLPSVPRQKAAQLRFPAQAGCSSFEELAGWEGQRLGAERFLDAQALVPFRHPLGAREAADLELADAPADGEM